MKDLLTPYDELFEARGRIVTLEVGPQKVHASLRLYHEDLDPQNLSETLQVECTYSHRKGDTHTTRSGRTIPPRTKGAWLISSKNIVASKKVNEHINWLLDQVSSCLTTIRKLQDAGYYSDIMCYWLGKCDNTCPELDVETIQRLSRFRLSCWFDVYLYDEDND